MGDRSSPVPGVALAIELVNTVDLLNDPPDFLRDLERLRRFLRHVGYEATWMPLTDADLEETRALRQRITEAMDADEGTAARLLDRLADGLDLRPHVVSTGRKGWEIRSGPPPEEGPSALGSSIVMGLMQLLVAGGWDRIGRCAGAPCCCVFVDRTRNRNRRFCCQLCADRVNQARARSRKRR